MNLNLRFFLTLPVLTAFGIVAGAAVLIVLLRLQKHLQGRQKRRSGLLWLLGVLFWLLGFISLGSFHGTEHMGTEEVSAIMRGPLLQTSTFFAGTLL